MAARVDRGPLVAGWLIGLHWSNGALFSGGGAAVRCCRARWCSCMGRAGFGKGHNGGNNSNNGAATRKERRHDDGSGGCARVAARRWWRPAC